MSSPHQHAPEPTQHAPGQDSALPRAFRLAYLVSHPIQYQAPLLRRIAREPGLELTVFFGSDFSVRGYQDEGFGVEVAWDVPLLEGYQYEFLPRLRDRGTEGLLTPINYGLCSRLIDRAGKPRFDALWVHGYSTVGQMYGILAANALGIPVLVRSDSSLRDRPRGALKLAAKRLFFGLLRPLIDGVLVSGTWNTQYWRHYMEDGFPLFLLPYAVDNDWFRERCREASAQRIQLQAELNLQPNRPVILFASKLQTRKQCDDLIAAYAHLVREADPACAPYLLVVGDGEERSALERQVAAAALHDVRFCGFRNQSELPRFFDLATVFVLPSRHEPWGLVVNEVMNAGCPVVVSDDVGCHPDLITSGVDGFVYPVRNVEALAEALRAVLSTPGRAAAMGEAAQRRIAGWSFEQDIAGLRQALTHVARRGILSARNSGAGT